MSNIPLELPQPIFVSGAAGFIGFHLSKRLLQSGLDVTGFDNVNDFYDVSLKRARVEILQKHDNFTFLENDLEDERAVEDIFERGRFQIVVHLAAQPGVRYSIKNPRAYINSNLIGFFNILEACRKSSPRHFVFASSSSVYGMNTTMPFSVHDNVDHPVSLYAASKKSNELMAHSYSHLYGVPATGLRFFTVYGPWGRPDMAYFKFARAIYLEEPLQLFNHGKMQRDFTYIDDIVDGVIAVMNKEPGPDPDWSGNNPDPGSSTAPFRIYNIGAGTRIELRYFLNLIEKGLGKTAIIKMQNMQMGDVHATFADIDDLARDFGYKPGVTVEEGMNRFLDWFNDYYVAAGRPIPSS